MYQNFHDSKIHAFEINSERYKLLDQNVKKNNFKEKLLSLKSLLNYDTITNIFGSNFYSRHNWIN
jgi:tRNA G37 N-methylase Trm5